MEVAENVKKAMNEISNNFPDGLSYEIPFDMTTYISESIHEVYKTLFEALILVIIVVFLSLQSWRATLIPDCGSTYFPDWYVRLHAYIRFFAQYTYIAWIGTCHWYCGGRCYCGSGKRRTHYARRETATLRGYEKSDGRIDGSDYRYVSGIGGCVCTG